MPPKKPRPSSAPPLKGAPPPQPPRSGRSLFLAQGSRPMVPPRARTPVQLTQAMERIARGEAGDVSRSLTPRKVVQPPAIPPRPVTHRPTIVQPRWTYPRHTTPCSLQYRTALEHTGASKASSSEPPSPRNKLRSPPHYLSGTRRPVWRPAGPCAPIFAQHEGIVATVDNKMTHC